MSTPQHVLDFNDTDGPELAGGLHFDDPDFETGQATPLYNEEVKQSKAKTPEHADLAAWLAKQTWSDFATSLATFYADRGYLTEKQVVSATSMKAKVEARETERNTGSNRGSKTGLDLSELPAGYYAVPGGDTRLKVVVNKATSGRWDGFTFVHDGAEYGSRTKYGMQAPDGTYKGKIEDQLRTIAGDPEAAGRAYAAITANCYRCNRKLEDETSVELGIGPICRNK